jgi:hypothetical protein
MIAKFQTIEEAQAYADQVHAYLQTFEGYIAEKWAEVGEDFTVPIFQGIEPINAIIAEIEINP